MSSVSIAEAMVSSGKIQSNESAPEDPQEKLQLRRLCRAVVLRSIIDILSFEVRGSMSGCSGTRDATQDKNYRDAKNFFESENCKSFCRCAHIPDQGITGILNLATKEAKEAVLIQLDRAYRAVTREGMR